MVVLQHPSFLFLTCIVNFVVLRGTGGFLSLWKVVTTFWDYILGAFSISEANVRKQAG